MQDHKLIERLNRDHPLNREADRHLQQAQPPLQPTGERELKVVSLARWGVQHLPLHDAIHWKPTLEDLLLELKRWTPKRQMNYFLRDSDSHEPSMLPQFLKESQGPDEGAKAVVEQLQHNLRSKPVGDLASPNALLRD